MVIPSYIDLFCSVLLYLSVICCAIWIFEFLMYISLKNTREIFMVIWLSLWISFVRIITFTILILSIHELGRSFHLLMSSSFPPEWTDSLWLYFTSLVIYIFLLRWSFSYIYCFCVHNSQAIKETCMFLNRWMDNENVIYILEFYLSVRKMQPYHFQINIEIENIILNEVIQIQKMNDTCSLPLWILGTNIYTQDITWSYCRS